jgi:hypothetical protein
MDAPGQQLQRFFFPGKGDAARVFFEDARFPALLIADQGTGFFFFSNPLKFLVCE